MVPSTVGDIKWATIHCSQTPEWVWSLVEMDCYSIFPCCCPSTFKTHWINSVLCHTIPDSKVHGANMGPTGVLSTQNGPHVGPMNPAIRDSKCVEIPHLQLQPKYCKFITTPKATACENTPLYTHASFIATYSIICRRKCLPAVNLAYYVHATFTWMLYHPVFKRHVALIRVYNVRTNQFVLDRTKVFSNDAYRQQVII